MKTAEQLKDAICGAATATEALAYSQAIIAQRAALLEAVGTARHAFTLQALRDRDDPATFAGWKRLEAIMLAAIDKARKGK